MNKLSRFIRTGGNSATARTFRGRAGNSIPGIFKFFMLAAWLGLWHNPASCQWTLTTCPDEVTLKCIAVRGDTVLSGTSDYLYLSADNGGTWNTVMGGIHYPADISALLFVEEKIFAGSGGGLYYSPDNGNSFAPLSIPFSYVSKLYMKNGQLYAVAGGSNWGLYVSPDTGSTWQKLSAGLPVSVYEIYSFEVFGGRIYAGTGSGVYSASMNGSGWQEENTGLSCFDVYVLLAKDTTLYAGTSCGVFCGSGTPVTWTSCSSGLGPDYDCTTLLAIGSDILCGGPYGGGAHVLHPTSGEWFDISGGLSSMQTLGFACNQQYIFTCTAAVSGFYTGGVYRLPASQLGSAEHSGDDPLPDFHPNPVSGILSIRLPDPLNARVEIYTLSGILVFYKDKVTDNEQLQTGNLKAGTYILKIKGKDYTRCFRMIKT